MPKILAADERFKISLAVFIMARLHKRKVCRIDYGTLELFSFVDVRAFEKGAACKRDKRFQSATPRPESRRVSNNGLSRCAWHVTNGIVAVKTIAVIRRIRLRFETWKQTSRHGALLLRLSRYCVWISIIGRTPDVKYDEVEDYGGGNSAANGFEI
jgi:hypothetical protein